MSKKVEERLAINGGPTAVTKKWPPWPLITEEDIQEVIRVMKEETIHSVRRVGVILRFEDDFARYHGRKYAFAVNGGTAALDIAVTITGAGPGDEILVSPYGWGSTVGCIIHNNTIPVFVDIDPRTYNMDPDKIEEKITPRTKAIAVTHLHGHPADMDPIMEIARRYDLYVIEDVAQAHGALYHGRKVGNIGHLAAFSIGDGKHVTGGEAGVLLLDDEKLYQRALLEGTHPGRHGVEITDPNLKRYTDSLGWNYRVHPLAAAIARIKLKYLDQQNIVRQKCAEYLSQGLKEIPGIKPPYVAPGCTHVFHMYCPAYKSEDLNGLPRNKFIQALNAEGVPIFLWAEVPFHLRPRSMEHYFYGKGCPWECPLASRKVTYKKGDCPVAERRCEVEELNLYWTPMVTYDEELLDQILAAFRKVTNRLEEAKKLDGKISTLYHSAV